MGETSITMRGRRGFELHTRAMAQPWGTPRGGFSPAGGAGAGTTDLGPRPPREQSQAGYLCMDIAFYFNIFFSIIVDI